MKRVKQHAVFGAIAVPTDDPEQGYRISIIGWCPAQNVKEMAKYYANQSNQPHIPLFFRNEAQAEYCGISMDYCTWETQFIKELPARHRGQEYKPTI